MESRIVQACHHQHGLRYRQRQRQMQGKGRAFYLPGYPPEFDRRDRWISFFTTSMPIPRPTVVSPCRQWRNPAAIRYMTCSSVSFRLAAPTFFAGFSAGSSAGSKPAPSSDRVRFSSLPSCFRRSSGRSRPLQTCPILRASVAIFQTMVDRVAQHVLEWRSQLSSIERSISTRPPRISRLTFLPTSLPA